MSDKQRLQVNNTNLLEHLSNIMDLPIGNLYAGNNPLTIGEEGATLPANTLLKEALQIINGVEPGVDCDMGMVELTTSSYIVSLPVTKQRSNYFFSGILYFLGATLWLVPTASDKTRYTTIKFNPENDRFSNGPNITIARYADQIDVRCESYVQGGYVYYCAW